MEAIISDFYSKFKNPARNTHILVLVLLVAIISNYFQSRGNNFRFLLEMKKTARNINIPILLAQQFHTISSPEAIISDIYLK